MFRIRIALLIAIFLTLRRRLRRVNHPTSLWALISIITKPEFSAAFLAFNGRILGAPIFAPERSDLVQTLGTPMFSNQAHTLLKGAVFIHPTLTEGLFSLMEDVKPVD